MSHDGEEVINAIYLRLMSAFHVILPEMLLEKLEAYINPALKSGKQAPATVTDIEGVIIRHVLAVSYNTVVSHMTASENEEFSFRLRGRVHEI